MRVALPGVISCAVVLALGACDESKPIKTDGPVYGHDIEPCYQPPSIDKCMLTEYSGTRVYRCTCSGSCGGGALTSACSEWTSDCRYFYNSCIPENYSTCGREATDRIAGLCGMCFFTDGGVRGVHEPLPAECNKLPDGGSSPKDALPQDAPPKDAGNG